MSNQSSTTGHWESHSHTSQSTKIGNNPATVSGRDASAEGTFDRSVKHGRPVVTDSQATSYTNQGHPNRLEFNCESGNQQKSIK